MQQAADQSRATGNAPAMQNAAFVNPHTLGNKLGRLAWAIVWTTLFRTSPWFMNGWRRFLLRAFGAKLGKCEFKPSVRIWAPWLLRVGDGVYFDRDVFLYNAFGMSFENNIVVSFSTVLCTASHDHKDPRFALIGKPITVQSDVWIAAEAFVTPGVTIGRGSVVGARAFVRSDVQPWTIVSGNPAVVVAQRTLRDGRAQDAGRA
jgi:putative colanic acid biosynthesis acetyltransferase WcaF